MNSIFKKLAFYNYSNKQKIKHNKQFKFKMKQMIKKILN